MRALINARQRVSVECPPPNFPTYHEQDGEPDVCTTSAWELCLVTGDILYTLYSMSIRTGGEGGIKVLVYVKRYICI